MVPLWHYIQGSLYTRHRVFCVTVPVLDSGVRAGQMMSMTDKRDKRAGKWGNRRRQYAMDGLQRRYDCSDAMYSILAVPVTFLVTSLLLAIGTSILALKHLNENIFGQ